MQDFHLHSASDKSLLEGDTEKLVVLPGFEVSQPRNQ